VQLEREPEPVNESEPEAVVHESEPEPSDTPSTHENCSEMPELFNSDSPLLRTEEVWDSGSNLDCSLQSFIFSFEQQWLSS
jgi:hypothetical protein